MNEVCLNDDNRQMSVATSSSSSNSGSSGGGTSSASRITATGNSSNKKTRSLAYTALGRTKSDAVAVTATTANTSLLADPDEEQEDESEESASASSSDETREGGSNKKPNNNNNNNYKAYQINDEFKLAQMSRSRSSSVCSSISNVSSINSNDYGSSTTPITSTTTTNNVNNTNISSNHTNSRPLGNNSKQHDHDADDDVDDDVNDNDNDDDRDETRVMSTGTNSNGTLISVDAFFDYLLANDQQRPVTTLTAPADPTTTTNNKTKTFLFICICCRQRFDNNRDFLRHIENEQTHGNHSATAKTVTPGSFKLDKRHESFILNELSCDASSTSTATTSPAAPRFNKIIVFLMESKMKFNFLNKYSHDLLATNEETALWLEDLNKEVRRKRSKKPSDRLKQLETAASVDENSSTTTNMYENELNDDYDDESGNDENDVHVDDAEFDHSNDAGEFENDAQTTTTTTKFSLLFVDYSIIQFNRVVLILKELYASFSVATAVPQQPPLASSAAAATTTTTSITLPVLMLNNSNKKSANSLKTKKTSFNSQQQYVTPVTSKPHQQQQQQPLSKQSSSSPRALLTNSNKTQPSNVSNSTPVLSQMMAAVSGKTTVKSQQASVANSQPTSSTTTNSIHSRNACKKLKCPKCNWHYKYRETLDIHMREKHSTDITSSLSQQCIYCIENTPHPRLGRGEQYKCGYKPYRCEICDYSTTTKGNLSIHMQSDKHINNLKELRDTKQDVKVKMGNSALGEMDFSLVVNAAAAAAADTVSTTVPDDSNDNSMCVTSYSTKSKQGNSRFSNLNKGKPKRCLYSVYSSLVSNQNQNFSSN
jgi:hypothetical protein